MCPFYILSTCPSKGLCTALADTILRGTENEADAIVMLTGKHAPFPPLRGRVYVVINLTAYKNNELFQ